MLKTKLNSLCLFIHVFDYPLFNSLLTSSPIPRHSRQPTSPGPWDSNAPGVGIRRGMPEGPDEGQDNFRLSFQWCRVLEGMSEGFVTHRKKKNLTHLLPRYEFAFYLALPTVESISLSNAVICVPMNK